VPNNTVQDALNNMAPVIKHGTVESKSPPSSTETKKDPDANGTQNLFTLYFHCIGALCLVFWIIICIKVLYKRKKKSDEAINQKLLNQKELNETPFND
jgi:hypothetical protein